MKIEPSPGAVELMRPGDDEMPRDQLKARLDLYSESIILHTFPRHRDLAAVRMISADDLQAAFTRRNRVGSGLLPRDTLWWSQTPQGPVTALWRPPRVWPAALMLEAFQPPRRFQLPMPGLIFACTPGRPPRIYAAKKRPMSPADPIFHAPLFNVFHDGNTCPGNHQFPQEVSDIPDSFFVAFFSLAGNTAGRSLKHPHNLLGLWEEIDGNTRYPLGDLRPLGTVADIIA